MSDYKIIIEVWPYHGIPKADVWPRIREFIVDADTFHDARKIADRMVEASAAHGKVWHANLRTVTTWPMLSASQNEAECPEHWMKRS